MRARDASRATCGSSSADSVGALTDTLTTGPVEGLRSNTCDDSEASRTQLRPVPPHDPNPRNALQPYDPNPRNAPRTTTGSHASSATLAPCASRSGTALGNHFLLVERDMLPFPHDRGARADPLRRGVGFGADGVLEVWHAGGRRRRRARVEPRRVDRGGLRERHADRGRLGGRTLGRPRELTVETDAGLGRARVLDDGRIAVTMGTATLAGPQYAPVGEAPGPRAPLRLDRQPALVLDVDDLAAYPLETGGPAPRAPRVVPRADERRGDPGARPASRSSCASGSAASARPRPAARARSPRRSRRSRAAAATARSPSQMPGGEVEVDGGRRPRGAS